MSVSDGEPNLRSLQAGQPPALPAEAAQALLALACECTGASSAALLALRHQRLFTWCERPGAPVLDRVSAWLLPLLVSGAAGEPGGAGALEAPGGPQVLVAPDGAGLEGCQAVPLHMEGVCVGALLLVAPRVAPARGAEALASCRPLAAACMGQHLARLDSHDQTERLLDLARASGDWMWETDEQARYRWISGDFERMTGLRLDQCVGEPVPEEQGVDGVGQPAQPAVMLRDKLLRPEPFARFASCLPAPGGVRYISRSGQPVFDSQGVFRGFRGTARDVTARKLSQQTQRERALLERQVAEAERSSRDKSEFMSRISHELRTPLNAIMGFGQLMSMDTAEPLGPGQRARLEGVQQAGRTLLTLIDALLEVAGVDDAGRPGAAAPSAAPVPDPAPATPAAPAQAHHHVLYVEDEPLNVVLMQEIFRGRPGWTLHVARDGAEGVDMAREIKPDLALIDMNLPDFNGIEVLRRLRADAALAGLRCIALSADAMAEQISAAREAGFDDYWTKPIDLTRLLASIGEALKAPQVPARP